MPDPAGGTRGAPLKRVLGPVSAVSIVVGSIIGVGIFLTPGGVVKATESGSLAMVAWIIGGVIAMLGALCFAELGTMYTRSGGQYAILRDSYGPLGGFLFVFCNATAIQCGVTAIIAVICAQHLGFAMTGAEPDGQWVLIIGTVVISGLALSNIVGVKYGATIQNVTVFAKVATLIAVGALAMFAEPATPAPYEEQTGAGTMSLLFAGFVGVYFAYGGWQHALWIGGEIKSPRKNVPLAMVGGVGLVIVVYLFANWAYLHLLGDAGVANSRTIAAEAVSQVLPSGWARFTALAVALSALGVLNAQLLSGPRLLFGMARDGKFFKPFALPHKRFHTPIWAITLISGLGLVLLWVAGFDRVDALLAGVVMIDAVFMGLTGLAVIVLRRRRPDAERSVRVPLYPVVPVVFVLGILAVIVGTFMGSTSQAALIGAAYIAAAVVCYYAFFNKAATSDAELKT